MSPDRYTAGPHQRQHRHHPPHTTTCTFPTAITLLPVMLLGRQWNFCAMPNFCEALRKRLTCSSLPYLLYVLGSVLATPATIIASFASLGDTGDLPSISVKNTIVAAIADVSVTTVSSTSSVATSLAETLATPCQLSPPLRFCTPPTPPPISVLLTSWRTVLCHECYRDAHDITYRNCTEYHFKENRYPSCYHEM